MPLLYNHAKPPPNGYDFTDPSGVSFNEKSLYDLVTKVQKYRTINGLPMGNPEAEIEAVYATKYPWLVSVYQPDHQKPVKPTETPKEAHYSEWLAKLWKAQIKESELADDDVVELRVHRCGGCKYLADSADGLSESVRIDTTRRISVLSKGEFFQLTPSCKLHNWHCGLAAMLRNPKTDKEYDGCWVKKSHNPT